MIYDRDDIDDYYDDDEYLRAQMFADPGGGSALRAASADNPRNLPCPTCHWPNVLTPEDVARGYQCDTCAHAMETGQDIQYYDEEEGE